MVVAMAMNMAVARAVTVVAAATAMAMATAATMALGCKRIGMDRAAFFCTNKRCKCLERDTQCRGMHIKCLETLTNNTDTYKSISNMVLGTYPVWGLLPWS
jgi:hypothetical protein